MTAKFLHKYSFLIGLLILLAIVFHADFGKLISIFLKINYLPLLFAGIFSFFTILTKSWRWNYLKKQQGISYSFKDSFLIYLVALAFGYITPGRIGEIIKIYYLKKDGYSYGKSLASVVSDRFLDIAALIFLTSLSLLLFIALLLNKIILLYIILVFGALAIFLLWQKKIIQKIFNKIFSLLIPEKYQQSWQVGCVDFLRELKKYDQKTYFYSGLITFLSWATYYSQIYFMSLSLNLKIPIIYLLAAITLTTLISMLPISFLGIGTREATFIVLLANFGANPESLIILSELILLNITLIGAGGALISIFKPLPIIKKYD